MANLPSDNALISKIKLIINGNPINFQFPPIIKSDNKGGTWKEQASVLPEPYSFFGGGTARDITLDFWYVVTGEAQGTGKWTASQVSKTIKTLRQYYYGTMGESLIIKFQAYDIVGSVDIPPWTFRSDSLSVSHSPTIIADGTGYYPLRTDLSMKLKFLIDGSGGQDSGADGPPGDDQTKTKLSGLSPLPSDLAWF